MKRLVSLLLTLALCLGLLTLPAAAADEETVLGTVRALGVMVGDERGNLNLSANVTRAQFAKMMVAASVHKDTVGDDTGYSLYKDVKRTHWASEYIRIAVEQGWFIGYTDGTFRPDNTIRLEEAATALLRLLGYTSADLTGVYPTAQLSKFKALDLDDGVSAARGQLLTRRECAQIFYNLMTAPTRDGRTYANTLGYTLTASGELDYAALVAAELRGPYTLEPGKALPFTENTDFYRNGRQVDDPQPQDYDVYYYNSNIRAIYLYSNRVTGTYTAAVPSLIAPSSVTVAGGSYTVGTSAAAYKLSAQGSFAPGDTVTLLLGMDGTVADVVDADVLTGVYYGVAVGSGSQSYTTAGGAVNAQRTLQVACTDGVVRTFSCSTEFDPGDVVSVTWSGGKSTVKRLSGGAAVSGKATAKQLGSTFFAEDAEILDTNGKGAWRRIYPARLAGATLTAEDVRFCATDDSGRITHLILDDVTGDLYDYGLVTSAVEASFGMNISSSYVYILKGAVKTHSSSNSAFNITEGGVRVGYESGKVSSMRNLEQGRAASITAAAAEVDGSTIPMAEDVQVYLRDGDLRTPANLNTLQQGGDWQLTVWYDDFACPAGGLVRIIEAKA